MSSSLQNKEVKKEFLHLANLLISPTQKTVEELSKCGFKQISVKKNEDQDNKIKNPLIIIEGEEYKTYKNLSNLIEQEPHAEHLSIKDIDKALSDFVSDILSKPEFFKEYSNLCKKIDETINEILKTYTDWWVISPVEDLILPDESFNIGTSEIKKLNASDKGKFFGNTNAKFDELFTQKFENQICVIVQVKSNNKNSAIDKGRYKIELVLDSVRSSIGTSFFCRIRNPLVIVSSEINTKAGMFSEKFEKDSHCRLEKSDLLDISALAGITSDLIDVEKPTKMQQRILRSLRWISSSVQDKEPEDKISKLCTALETLLIPESEGRKGEKIAYRTTLLQLRDRGHFTRPERALLLYEKRSEVIHGSDYDQDPPNKQDVRSLEFLAKSIFSMVCKAISEHRFSKISQLIIWLETDDELKQGLDKWIKDNCDSDFTKALFGS